MFVELRRKLTVSLLSNFFNTIAIILIQNVLQFRHPLMFGEIFRVWKNIVVNRYCKVNIIYHKLYYFCSIGKLPRLLVATADGYLYIYNIDPEEGGDCTLLKQHRYMYMIHLTI